MIVPPCVIIGKPSDRFHIEFIPRYSGTVNQPLTFLRCLSELALSYHFNFISNERTDGLLCCFQPHFSLLMLLFFFLLFHYMFSLMSFLISLLHPNVTVDFAQGNFHKILFHYVTFSLVTVSFPLSFFNIIWVSGFLHKGFHLHTSMKRMADPSSCLREKAFKDLLYGALPFFLVRFHRNEFLILEKKY